LKALISVGYNLPINKILLSTGTLQNKVELLSSIRMLANMNITLYATRGTSRFLKEHDISTEILNWPLEKDEPNVMTYLENGKIDLVINIPKNALEDELTNDYMIRRKAVDFGINLITNLKLAQRFIETVARKDLKDLKIQSWDEF
jgi:carbamoyl-phosphate synthase large subunit